VAGEWPNKAAVFALGKNWQYSGTGDTTTTNPPAKRAAECRRRKDLWRSAKKIERHLRMMDEAITASDSEYIVRTFPQIAPS